MFNLNVYTSVMQCVAVMNVKKHDIKILLNKQLWIWCVHLPVQGTGYFSPTFSSCNCEHYIVNRSTAIMELQLAFHKLLLWSLNHKQLLCGWKIMSLEGAPKCFAYVVCVLSRVGCVFFTGYVLLLHFFMEQNPQWPQSATETWTEISRILSYIRG